jgi:hypothetical protein
LAREISRKWSGRMLSRIDLGKKETPEKLETGIPGLGAAS